MKIKTTILFTALALLVSFSACKDGDDKPGKKDSNTSTGKLKDSDKANLYDKVWYSTSSAGGIDLEFLIDGTFRQAKSLEGTYVWQEKGDTMNVVDYSDKKFNYVFEEITGTTMKFRSNSGGNNYQTLFIYSTTK